MYSRFPFQFVNRWLLLHPSEEAVMKRQRPWWLRYPLLIDNSIGIDWRRNCPNWKDCRFFDSVVRGWERDHRGDWEIFLYWWKLSLKVRKYRWEINFVGIILYKNGLIYRFLQLDPVECGKLGIRAKAMHEVRILNSKNTSVQWIYE